MTVRGDRFKPPTSDDSGDEEEKWMTIRNNPSKSDSSDDSDEKIVVHNRPERTDSILEEEARLRELKRVQEERYSYMGNLLGHVL